MSKNLNRQLYFLNIYSGYWYVKKYHGKQLKSSSANLERQLYLHSEWSSERMDAIIT